MTAGDKKLLILDLDETLIYATEEPLERHGDFIAGQYTVYKRPFVDEFLNTCDQWFELAVWTTSTEAYAGSVVGNLFPSDIMLSFVWARKRCTPDFRRDRNEQLWIKDLKKVKKLGYQLEHVIVVDDSPENHRRNYGNLVQVTAFTGDPEDRELMLLLRFLKYLSKVENIRNVEKRYWMDSLSEKL